MRVCPKCRSQYSVKTQFCGIDGEKLIETNADPLIGQVLGKYRLVAPIGMGAAGCVYRALHTTLDAEFAIKVLRGDLGADESLVGRFRREAQAASRIRSPNVVSVLDFETTALGLSYLVMEYAPGRPLNQLIDQEAPFEPLRAARILEGVAAGLAAAHALGFVHRDVKPSNILILSAGSKEVPKLLDFGIVRVDTPADDPEAAERLTQEGKVIGTPAYMSPEQWVGKQVRAPADLYGLGVVLYEMLSGTKPFRAPELQKLIGMHLNEPPPPLPPAAGLELIALRLLSKDPAERAESAAALREEVDQIVTELSFAASDSGNGMAAVRRGSVIKSAEMALLETKKLATPLAEDVALVRPKEGEGTSLDAGLTAAPEPHSASQLSPAPRRISPLLVGSLLAVLGALIFAGTVVLRPEVPVTVVATPVRAAPVIGELEKQLDRALAAAGLDLLDLKDLAPEASARWTAALAGSDAERGEEALKEIQIVLANATITPELLRKKLDRYDSALAAQAEKLPSAEGETLKADYLELYKAIQDGLGRDQYRALAQRAAAFARRLESKTTDR